MKGRGKQEKQDDTGDEIVREESVDAEVLEATGCEDGDTDGTSEVESDQAAAQLADMEDRYVRLVAEYENYRRRTQKEKEAMYGDSVASVTAEWLSVIDNLERAAGSASQCTDETAQPIIEGLELVLRQTTDILVKLGVEPIEAVGQPFDPELHEAVMHVEMDDVDTATIVEEYQKGYRRGDRIIRHSMVKVAN